MNKKWWGLLTGVLLFCSLMMLTGCPWGGMKSYPAEKTNAWMRNGEVCFSVPDNKDYQPVFIGINLRGTPPIDKKSTESSELRVVNGQLCISPSYYHFQEGLKIPYIIEFVLRSQDESHHPRSFVAGFSIINGSIENVPLTKREYNKSER